MNFLTTPTLIVSLAMTLFSPSVWGRNSSPTDTVVADCWGPSNNGLLRVLVLKKIQTEKINAVLSYSEDLVRKTIEEKQTSVEMETIANEIHYLSPTLQLVIEGKTGILNSTLVSEPMDQIPVTCY